MLLCCSEHCGNILNVDTTGALEATEKQCSSYCRSSCLREDRRRTTWRNTMPRWQKLGTVRSHAGAVLKDGLGDHENAFGLMQVWSTFLKTQISSFLYGSQKNFILDDKCRKVSPAWTKKGGISAYNAGVNTVHTYNKMDIGKTHNYANDVDVRDRFCKTNGY
uniref:Lysozyme n=1 Tax=Cyanistes caeruleus TaxID=156563 RepID=A0A8C0ZIF0_CYACU